jgi:hypothetical protein
VGMYWGCWSRRTFSHDRLGRPCYPACGILIRGWNQDWKKRIGNTNWH